MVGCRASLTDVALVRAAAPRSGGPDAWWWSGGLDPATWVGDGEGAVGLECEFPAAFMDCVVMFTADREEIVKVGWPAVFPVVDVVGFSELERHAAAGYGTGGVESA